MTNYMWSEEKVSIEGLPKIPDNIKEKVMNCI
jgi:hypothetical protein